MRAGAMTERVTIQSESRTANGQGGYSRTWANIPTAPTVWAEITGLSGDESIQASIERGSIRYRVTIRKRADVTPQNRLLWGSVPLDIKSVMPHPRHKRSHLLLLCESGLSKDGS